MNNDFLDFRDSTFIISEEGLMHFGTKGHSGRYPLGSGEDPYQDYPHLRKKNKVMVRNVSYTGKQSLLQKHKAKKEAKKQAKQRAEAIAKELLDRKEQEEYENNRERILKTGKASEVKKYWHELDNSEKTQIVNRLNLDKQLRSYEQDELDATRKRIERLNSNIKLAGDIATNSANLAKGGDELMRTIKKYVDKQTNKK